MPKKLNLYSLPLVALLALLVSGCGKKANERSNSDKPDNFPTLPEIEQQLSKQEVFCGSASACPSYLAKVAVTHREGLKFCTGFLIEKDVLVTASSCLPERLRSKEVSCTDDVHFFFPRSGKPLRIGCDKVLEVTNSNAKEPFLWGGNTVFLKLTSKMDSRLRQTINTNRSGMADGDEFNIWAIDQIDRYQGIIRPSKKCNSVHHSFFNPLSINALSSVMTLAGCEYSEGNAGAPVIDLRGRVRGVVAGAVAKETIDDAQNLRILERPLKKFMHISNYACAPLYPANAKLYDDECLKVLDLDSYKSAQKTMSESGVIFQPAINKLKSLINNGNQNIYIKLGIKLVPDEEEFHQLQIYPQCYKDVASWVTSFPNNPDSFKFFIMVPQVKVKKYMSEVGKIGVKEVTKVDANDKIEYVRLSFEFNPRVLRTVRSSIPRRKANLSFWNDGAYTFYQNFTDSCDSLL